MRKKKNEPDYEIAVPVPFADQRLNQYCCYCGNVRGSTNTTNDHVPSIGIFFDNPPKLLPTVKVCGECNRKHTQAESYSYCILSVAISGSTRPNQQCSSVARRILENDKRLRREMATSITISDDGTPSIRIDKDLFLQFLIKQARGHIFLECSELKLTEPNHKFWQPYHSTPRIDVERFFARASDIFPEIGSRGFVRLLSGSLDLDGFEVDQNGFVVLKRDSYRFRIILSNGGIMVQSIIYEYLLTEVGWY